MGGTQKVLMFKCTPHRPKNLIHTFGFKEINANIILNTKNKNYYSKSVYDCKEKNNLLC